MEQINLIKKFFKSLKCNILESENQIEINNIPKDFQEFYKPGPYILNYSETIKIKEILSIIKKYLNKRKGTSLLKIEFEIDPLEKISKVVSLKNCELSNIAKKHENNFFTRFTFLTTFRYLNETKQSVNDIYVHEGEIVQGDLSDYQIKQGTKSETGEIPKEKIEADFNLAKNHLKQKLQQDLEEISSELNKKLDQEILKVKEHFKKNFTETEKKLGEHIERIKQLQFDSYEENKDKINRILQNIEKIEEQKIPEKLSKEEEFVIKDLRQKHSLAIENNLINTTIIYYPIFIFNLNLKNDNIRSSINLTYNPLTNSLEKIKCHSCKNTTNILALCSSGHIVCKDCISHCGDCGKELCLSCLKYKCDKCGKKLCQKCMKRCPECRTVLCKQDLREDALTKEPRCLNCLVSCSYCHRYISKGNAKKSSSNGYTCYNCISKQNQQKISKEIFKLY